MIIGRLRLLIRGYTLDMEDVHFVVCLLALFKPLFFPDDRQQPRSILSRGGGGITRGWGRVGRGANEGGTDTNTHARESKNNPTNLQLHRRL